MKATIVCMRGTRLCYGFCRSSKPCARDLNGLAVTHTAKGTPLTRDILSENPFRFSSEVHDNSLGLVYYNYRHYNPKDGRWLGRDPVKEHDGYIFLYNEPMSSFDIRGTIGSRIVVGPTVLPLSRASLLDERYHGGIQALWARHPVAFTRGEVAISYRCFCDSAIPGYVGEISAMLYLTIFIYDSSESVSVLLSGGIKGDRSDVLRHEHEHARDIIDLFNRIYSSTNTFDSFYSLQDCEHEMSIRAAQMNSAYDTALTLLSRNGGHNAAKFQEGGDAFVEAEFVE